jgi:hypothetical protein
MSLFNMCLAQHVSAYLVISALKLLHFVHCHNSCRRTATGSYNTTYILSWYHFRIILREEDSTTADYVLKYQQFLLLMEANISTGLAVYLNIFKR